jgi:hypothetical protein
MWLGGESMISCRGDAAIKAATVPVAWPEFQNIPCVKIRHLLLLPSKPGAVVARHASPLQTHAEVARQCPDAFRIPQQLRLIVEKKKSQ